jgi:hypothetical protein
MDGSEVNGSASERSEDVPLVLFSGYNVPLWVGYDTLLILFVITGRVRKFKHVERFKKEGGHKKCPIKIETLS